MKLQIPLGQLLATFLLFGCTQHALEPVVQRDDRVERAYADGLTEPYVRFVERGRMHLRQGELILAEYYFELAATQSLFERPNYEVWLELAETKCRLMRLKEGFDLLNDFDAALEVEFGEALCFAAGGRELRNLRIRICPTAPSSRCAAKWQVCFTVRTHASRWSIGRTTKA